MNSKLISFYYAGRAIKGARRLFPKVVINNLREFPIPSDIQSEDLVNLVERTMAYHEKHALAKTPAEQNRLQRDIAAVDNQIDRLVYQLYGLWDEEIALIESSAAAAAPHA